MNNRPFFRIISIVLGIILLLGIWQLSISFHAVPEYLLPSPKRVFIDFAQLIQSKSFWIDLFATLESWLLSVIIGTIAGGVIGFALGMNKYVWYAFEPIVEFFRSLPSIVLVPLVSLFVGVGFGSRLVCGSMVVSFILISNTAAALRVSTATHLKLSASWKWKISDRLFYILIPSGLTQMLVGLRTAIPICLIVIVAADMLVATDSGIGKIIMDSSAVFAMPRLYSAIFVVGSLGYLSSILSNYLEKKTTHWIGK